MIVEAYANTPWWKTKKFASMCRYAGTAIGLVALVALLGSPLSEISSVISTAKATPVPTANAYGFSTSLDELSRQALDQRLTAMHSTGAKWVRIDISWDMVQSRGPNSYNWAPYDQVFASINAHGMQAVGAIDFVPSWARGDCSNSKFCPPADPNAYGNFAAAVATRYGHYGMRDWEIWNEENISYRFHPASNPGIYTPMLKAAYTDIKKVDPAATVIMGGTAPAGEDPSGDMKPNDFLAAVYKDGGKGYFDAVATHPYTYPNSPAAGLSDAWGQMSDMHNTMAANGDGNKKLWITEFGSPTNGPDVSGDHVTEADQAHILSDAIRIWSSYSWSGPFFVYDYQDNGTSTASSENFYGMVRADGSRKPAYDVWTQAVTSH